MMFTVNALYNVYSEFFNARGGTVLHPYRPADYLGERSKLTFGPRGKISSTVHIVYSVSGHWTGWKAIKPGKIGMYGDI
jgi:hypothetical protein